MWTPEARKAYADACADYVTAALAGDTEGLEAAIEQARTILDHAEPETDAGADADP